jgi:hypothetical protein
MASLKGVERRAVGDFMTIKAEISHSLSLQLKV